MQTRSFASLPHLARLALAAGLLTAPGCGDGGPADGPAGGGPLYLVSTWIASNDETHTYVGLVDSLDEDVDLSQALEVGGYGDAWVYESWVFVADGESPTLRRYALGADGKLALEKEINFGDTGATSTAFYDNQILSRTKAYLANAAEREYVVWNPETMKITGRVPWPEIPLEEGMEPFHSYTDRGGEIVDGKFFHGLYQHNEDWDAFGSSSVIAVYDVATDALIDTITVPCPMMDVASVADGYLYVSGWSYMPLSAKLGKTARNCAARIDLATRKVDPSWTFNFVDVTPGKEGMAVRSRDGKQGTIAVFHGSDVPVTDETGIWDLDAGDDDWEIYAIDLETKAVTPTGTKMGSGSFYDTHLGDSYFVYLPGNTETQVYEYTNGTYQPRFKAQGWMSRLFQVR